MENSNEIRKKDLITFYRYKRTFLLIDEWSFYILLLVLYYNISAWVILGIMFYGGTGIYTSYKNLEKIEKQIVSIDQDIYLIQDTIHEVIRFSKLVMDYFSQRRQNIFSRDGYNFTNFVRSKKEVPQESTQEKEE
jgi:hypothetical protein